MENYDKLLKDIQETVGRISELYDLAFIQYSRAADEILANRLTGEKQIEHILDGILDFCDDERFLELSRKLCRHIYFQYPQLVGDFVNMYRLLFEEDTDGNGDD